MTTLHFTAITSLSSVLICDELIVHVNRLLYFIHVHKILYLPPKPKPKPNSNPSPFLHHITTVAHSKHHYKAKMCNT
jgi:hypothetical protein